MTESFSAFCARLGLPLRNERWSWCAVNDERRQAVFTIWKDRLDQPEEKTIDFSWLNDPSRTDNGAREFRRVMAKVTADRFAAYGILCEAVDVEARPRKRKRFERELLVLDINIEDGRTVAAITGVAAPEMIITGGRVVEALAHRRSAIDDLYADSIGNVAPERQSGGSTFFPRDERVRRYVVRRSRGACEFCGAPGFEKPDGQRYIETHHIISLAKQGPDTVGNVIALCATHHREAHYGLHRRELEVLFLTRLRDLQSVSKR